MDQIIEKFKYILSLIKKKYCYDFCIDLLFWSGFLCVLCSETFAINWFQNIISGGVVCKIGMVLLWAKILLDKRFFQLTIKTKVLQLLAIGTGIGTFVSSGFTELLLLMTVVVAASNINRKYIQRCFTFIISVTFILNVLLVGLGMKLQETFIEPTSGHGYKMRYSLGFGHPNGAMMFYVYVIICLIIVFGDKINNIMYIMFLTCGLIIFYYTDTRSGVLALIVVIILALLRDTIVSKFLNRIQYSKWFCILSIVSMITLGEIFDGKRLIKSEYYGSFISRIMVWGMTKDVAGFSLLGKSWERTCPVDCGFFRLIFFYGFIGFAVFCILYFAVINREKDNYLISACIVGLCTIFIFEARLIYVFFGLPLITIFTSDNCVYNRSEIYLYINSIIKGAILTLLIGHNILQHRMELLCENGSAYHGPSPYIMDIVFLALGIVLGYAVCRSLNMYYEKKGCNL